MRRIITVGREFGSGGREIGRRIAEELQIAYYDQEIITEIAKRTALSEAYIRQIEEKRPVVSFPIHIGHSFYLSPDPTFHPDLSIYTKQHDLLHELARKSDCVIVGRCADFILRDQKPIRIFSYADMRSKIKCCIDRRPVDENLSEAQMKNGLWKSTGAAHSIIPSSLSRRGERRKTLTCWQTHPALTLKRCLNPYVVTLGLIINE